MVIGVTGQYAAGKDEVTKLLVQGGCTEINVDALGHRALAERAAEIGSVFGPAILGPDDEVNRRALGALVFRDLVARARLEAIVHPRMKELVDEELRRISGDCVINAALLFPMGLDKKTDFVIVVRARWWSRLVRARRRDRLPWRELCARFRAQRKIIPQQLPRNVDMYTVWNTRTKTYLKDQLETINRNRPGNGKRAARE
jgi:dephospho-CoA kinase